MAVRNASAYYGQLVALLPPGPAWDVERVPAIRDLLREAAEELAREDLRLSDLFNEMFPDTVRELVPDWERVMDLPDPCLGESPAFEDRQLAVRRRLVEVGGQSRAFFIDLAISQGYPGATITEHRAPRFGNARFGRAHFGTWSAQFMWTLNTGPRRKLGRRFGVSFWGERFGANPSGALECVIRRGAPAHALEFINYGEAE